jgi:hypothetical protein
MTVLRPTPTTDDLIQRAVATCDEARNVLQESKQLCAALRQLIGARAMLRGEFQQELDSLRRRRT